MNRQWHEPGAVPGWMLELAHRADPGIESGESHADTQQRIDSVLAELQERAAHPVDPELAHQHRPYPREAAFAAGDDPGCPPDWWGTDYPTRTDGNEDVQ